MRFRAGETWDGGAPQSQPGWDEHAAFVDALAEDGTIVMGGPFSDHTGAMLLMEGITVDEARRIVQLDPFVKNGVFVIDDVRDWTLYVGAA